ncbi:PaaI family thioesterase [Bordetella trematum]|uniref:PaaI family thioesterase n=1 Tax=Bordetella trematum TaxID=123899 RepID=UPI003AF33ABB
MGIEQVSVKPGFATLEWSFDPDRYANGLGIAHGGVIGTLLDVVMGYACGYQDQKVSAVVTTGMTIHYLAAAQNKLIATAQVERQTRHLAFSSATVRSTDGSLLAQAMATFKKTTPRTQQPAESSLEVWGKEQKVVGHA